MADQTNLTLGVMQKRDYYDSRRYIWETVFMGAWLDASSGPEKCVRLADGAVDEWDKTWTIAFDGSVIQRAGTANAKPTEATSTTPKATKA